MQLQLQNIYGGSVEGFANIMNEKAKELGLKNSHFVTPHGLDNDEHYTTAYDLAILTNYALKNEKFKEIVGVKTTTIMVGNYPRTITNTNELLGNVPGVYGVKTGFTGKSGRCLVTACKRDNLDIIIVVLGADTKNIRGLDTKSIINYVFSSFEMIDTYQTVKDAFEKFDKIKNIKVQKSLDEVSLKLSENNTYIYPIEKNKINDLKTSIYCVSLINFNIPENSKLGALTLKCNNKILYSLDLILNNKIKRTTWQEYIKIFICDYKNYFK